jgi:D-alanyl-lipoteichoic acid acyltransferase DltB (MBOAT superfamily)
MAFVPKYILILFATIAVNYYASRALTVFPNYRKPIFIATIFANIAILGFFKYFNFFIDNLQSVGHFLGWNYSLPLLSIVLPIGLSFHTFQALSYVIEVYKGKQKPEPHFGIYSLYVMYYPQLVAGPIERPQNLLPQFHTKQEFSASSVIAGLKRMAWGFFKKTVVADRVAIYVNLVYANPTDFNGPTIALAVVLFAVQLYCDFSGYSDIAVGSSQVMGIRLMENFKRPYFSKSIAEFWRRWHISLSEWLRDYVYYPLALSGKKSQSKLYIATIITFLLSGLWHGAAWHYVLMGFYFGSCIVLAELTKGIRKAFFGKLTSSYGRIFRYTNQVLTFMLVCIGWVFFRAESFTHAIVIFKQLHVGVLDMLFHATSYATWKNIFSLHGLLVKSDFVVILLGSITVLLVDVVERKKTLWEFLQEQNSVVRWFVYYLIVLVVLLYGRFGAQDFIYFQF